MTSSVRIRTNKNKKTKNHFFFFQIVFSRVITIAISFARVLRRLRAQTYPKRVRCPKWNLNGTFNSSASGERRKKNKYVLASDRIGERSDRQLLQQPNDEDGSHNEYSTSVHGGGCKRLVNLKAIKSKIKKNHADFDYTAVNV